MRNRLLSLFTATLGALVLTFAGSANAIVMFDYSPDTLGVGNGSSGYTNHVGDQIIVDRFTLTSSVMLTGGSTFGNQQFAPSIGDPVQFMIFQDATGAPALTPLINITASIDAVDSVLTTSLSNLRRQHASITPTALVAGIYWFSMPGSLADITAADTVDGSGYDDDRFYFSSGDSVPDLQCINGCGDMFFTLEGSSATIPEPTTLALMGLGLAGIGFGRKLKKA